MLRFVYIFLISLLVVEPAQAGGFKMRARESYDVHQMEYLGQEADYRGLSNTFNLWYEEPFDIAYGIAAGSLFSKPTTKETPLPGVGDSIRILFAGLEVKYFPMKTNGFFTRVGFYWNQIDTRGTAGKLDGWSYLASAGYEFLLWDKLGIAPEIGVKQGDTKGLFFTTVTVAIAFHFYMF